MSADVAQRVLPEETGARRRARDRTLRWRAWRHHFTDNRARQRHFDRAIPWSSPVTLTEDQRRVWVRSLQKFQVGESGDGAHLLAAVSHGDEDDYLTCARSFVAEEAGHARILEALLERLDAPTIGADWTDALFVRARRLMGVATELAVIQVAEGVALVYYGALAEDAPDEAIQAAAIRILADEEMHVLFHAERIRQDLVRWSRPRRAALRALWWGAQVGATAVVWVDHRHALADAGLAPFAAVSAVWRTIAGIRHRTYAGEDRPRRRTDPGSPASAATPSADLGS